MQARKQRNYTGGQQIGGMEHTERWESGHGEIEIEDIIQRKKGPKRMEGEKRMEGVRSGVKTSADTVLCDDHILAHPLGRLWANAI